jgi:multidrug transporter EmrE-like cation transporter
MEALGLGLLAALCWGVLKEPINQTQWTGVHILFAGIAYLSAS